MRETGTGGDMDDFWKFEEAEMCFGDVVHQALTNAPQVITREDGKRVVLLSEAHHDRLTDALRMLIELGGTPPDPVLLPLERLVEEERGQGARMERDFGGR